MTSLLNAAKTLPTAVRDAVRAAEAEAENRPLPVDGTALCPVADAAVMAQKYLAGDPNWRADYGLNG